MHLDALRAYQSVHATTADPGQLVVTLLDRALHHLGDAVDGLAAGDRGRFIRGQHRAHAIVAALAASLDLEAANLLRLYDFMLRRLTEGLLTLTPANLVRVRQMLTEIRDGFAGALEAARA